MVVERQNATEVCHSLQFSIFCVKMNITQFCNYHKTKIEEGEREG